MAWDDKALEIIGTNPEGKMVSQWSLRTKK
jgi:hypothetical protein